MSDRCLRRIRQLGESAARDIDSTRATMTSVARIPAAIQNLLTSARSTTLAAGTVLHCIEDDLENAADLLADLVCADTFLVGCRHRLVGEIGKTAATMADCTKIDSLASRSLPLAVLIRLCRTCFAVNAACELGK